MHHTAGRSVVDGLARAKVLCECLLLVGSAQSRTDRFRPNPALRPGKRRRCPRDPASLAGTLRYYAGMSLQAQTDDFQGDGGTSAYRHTLAEANASRFKKWYRKASPGDVFVFVFALVVPLAIRVLI